MKNLYKSLAKFQNELKGIPKDSSGYGYKYCKLETLIKIVTPTLSKNGLVLFQSIDTDEQSRLPSVKTTLAHIDSGEAIESWTPVSEVKLGSMNLYQSVGAGITYFRRYSLQGILGIAPDDDIDASDKPSSEPVTLQVDTKKTASPKPTPVITSKPKSRKKVAMTEKNYEEIKKHAIALKDKKNSWKVIQGRIGEKFIIDMAMIHRMEKEIYKK